MALSNFKKNYSIVSSSPNSGFRVLNHDSGSAQSDKVLLVVVTMASTTNYTGATYDGNTMTQEAYLNLGTLQQRQIVYSIANPSDGTNQFRVNFSGNQWAGVSIACYTFIGCSGIGNTVVNGGSTTPHTQTLSCSNNSIIMCTGVSNNAFQPFVIDSVSYTALFSHNTNKQVAGVLSNNVSTGTINVTSVVGSGDVTNLTVELQEAAATPPSSNSGNFLMMFN